MLHCNYWQATSMRNYQ